MTEDDDKLSDKTVGDDEEGVSEVEESEGQEEEERIEDLELYRLDYECDDVVDPATASRIDETTTTTTTTSIIPRAAGGEILKPGDHIYMWCHVYQHHGIVLETYPNNSDVHTTNTQFHFQEQEMQQQQQQDADISEIDCDNNDGGGSSILVAEFTNADLTTATAAIQENNAVSSLFNVASTAAGATSGGGVTGGFRFVMEAEPHLKWHKVKYKANPLECLTWRPGTCSAACCLPVTEILTRVSFLNECRHLIPDYHLLASNCETVAVWCVTGQWETLQGDSVVKFSALGTAAAAATSLAMAPVGVALAATSGGLALWRSLHLGKQWDDTATLLNEQYAWYSLGKTPVFSFRPTA